MPLFLLSFQKLNYINKRFDVVSVHYRYNINRSQLLTSNVSQPPTMLRPRPLAPLWNSTSVSLPGRIGQVIKSMLDPASVSASTTVVMSFVGDRPGDRVGVMTPLVWVAAGDSKQAVSVEVVVVSA